MSHRIGDITALEACIGKTPAAVNMKVIDHLDAAALRWIELSPLVFAAFGDRDGIGVKLGGGAAGFVRADSARLHLPRAALDDVSRVRGGVSFGALFLVPALGETLRVNGRVVSCTADSVEIEVQECFLHCAKALIRSEFWSGGAQSTADGEPDFLAASRFMVVASIDAQGRADVSPKGDPAGRLLHLQGGNIWYADRPGNRRADSFRNILAQPCMAIAALVPGVVRVAVATGSAQLSTDPAMCAAFAVDGRAPKLATCIERPVLAVQESAALARAQLWPVGERPRDIDPASIFAGHVRLNKTGGLQGKVAKAMVSIPGMMAQSLKLDYKHNLY